ncbi:MAG: RES domain-containing protein [Ruminococcaceae bacterium]|nr:RES domain-containing protein [Oscillospiraceae bacterium]
MDLLPKSGNLKELSKSDAFLKIILFLFYSDAKNKANKEWKKFSDNLFYGNRFSSNSSIINELHNKADVATYMIPAGEVLYRARIFNEDIMDSFVRGYVWPKENDSEGLDSIPKLNLNASQVLPLIVTANPKAGFTYIQEAYNQWKRKKFKGYDSKQSGPPPKEKTPAGRANPECIRYLYLCEDAQTPVYEVHPTIGQEVSIARFKTKKPLKIYDLTLSLPNKHKNPDYDTPSLYDAIGKNFSIPNTGEAIQYLPTQYISEEIKKLGFDGLRFNSSLRQGGINVVLFDPEVCNVQSSDIVKVDSIEIKTRKPDVYSLESLDASILDI